MEGVGDVHHSIIRCQVLFQLSMWHAPQSLVRCAISKKGIEQGRWDELVGGGLVRSLGVMLDSLFFYVNLEIQVALHHPGTTRLIA